MAHLRLGSEEHKKLFCREFINTFKSFKVSDIKWPGLSEVALARLRSLPFWGEAIKTERTAGERVRKMADYEKDPLIREAIAMQSHEEQRHAGLIEALMRQCGLKVPDTEGAEARSPEWGFIRMGYGEVFDCFFAFGLFKIAGDSGFFPKELMEIFEPFMQEEARHVLFFQNWAAYRNRNLSAPLKPYFALRRALAMAIQALGRIDTAVKLRRGAGAGEDFVMEVPDAIKGDEITVRSFAEICLAENQRRLSSYDPRLLRPNLVPRLVKATLQLTQRKARPAGPH